MKRKFSNEDKLQVIKDASEMGVKAACEKHGVFPASYYSWKKKLQEMGMEGLKHGMTPAHLKEIKRLEKENALLKKLVAEKELEGQLKDELIKKKYPLAKR